ncbi:hypothetical protein llap_2361 [Limosa lapponica baueri]|uniref:Uncharacterized protein n=1 Tax=Limosa lapponica baueri TaxID=1758121 RepID=A0A2I0UMQ1_LIMLA|nr:hypothetical protein llap_2361 [Limosa lapponica baueri]
MSVIPWQEEMDVTASLLGPVLLLSTFCHWPHTAGVLLKCILPHLTGKCCAYTLRYRKTASAGPFVNEHRGRKLFQCLQLCYSQKQASKDDGPQSDVCGQREGEDIALIILVLERWESISVARIFTDYMALEDVKRLLLRKSRDENFSSPPSP